METGSLACKQLLHNRPTRGTAGNYAVGFTLWLPTADHGTQSSPWQQEEVGAGVMLPSPGEPGGWDRVERCHRSTCLSFCQWEHSLILQNEADKLKIAGLLAGGTKRAAGREAQVSWGTRGRQAVE